MKKKIAVFLSIVLILAAFCAITASAVAPGKTGTFFTNSDLKTVYCPQCGLFMGYSQSSTQSTYENGKVVYTYTLTIGPMRCLHCGYVVTDGSNIKAVEDFKVPGFKMG